jgi:hypothetical protein
LAPVLGLFIVRFAPRYAQPMGVLEAPVFVEPTHAGAPQGGDWVVGVTFEGQAYALPFRALYATPIVTVTDYNKRMLLMWSSGANRATAVHITRDLRPRALEIVSTPGDGLLIFDHRYGQFISAITARTTKGGDPIGFGDRVAVIKTTWAVWRAMQPDTRVMLPADTGPAVSARPLGPRVALPKRATRDAPAQTMVWVLDCRPPVAVRSDLPLKTPINALAGQTRLLIVRDPRTGSVRAYDRRVSDDLFPTFSLHSDPRRHSPSTLVDSDTASAWTIDGRAISGPLKGEQLREIPSEDFLWWGVMKFWYADLQLLG